MSLPNQRKAPAPAVIDRLLTKLKSGDASVHRVGKELKLTPKQIKFAELYASGFEEYNNTRCAMEAYGIDSVNGAQLGWQNMQHPCILALIDMIFVAAGLSTVQVSKELVKALKQDLQPSAKVAAAKLIFELNGTLDLSQMTINLNQKPVYDFTILSDEDLETYNRITKLLEATVKTINIEGRTVNAIGIDDGGNVPTESL